MRSVLPFDELNRLVESIRDSFPDGIISDGMPVEDIIDEMLDLFLLSYSLGNNVTNASLNSDWRPSTDEVMSVVDKEVAGKTWRDRVREYFSNNGSVEDIVRIAETESHRIANTAALDTAVHGGATKKKWVTMLDDRVRDSHVPLEGQSIPIDADFYTWDGDHAPAPGLFTLPENNINCRCELFYTRD